MSSKERSRRDRAFHRSLEVGIEMAPCTRCTKQQLTCLLAKGYSRCAACIKAARPCDCTGVPLSAWKSVDNALEKLNKEEKQAEKDMEAAYARLLRIRKLKRFQENREQELLERDALTLDELDAAAEPRPESPVPPLSPSFWESLGAPFDPQNPSPALGS